MKCSLRGRQPKTGDEKQKRKKVLNRCRPFLPNLPESLAHCPGPCTGPIPHQPTWRQEFNAAFLHSQKQSRRQKEVEAAQENVAEGRRLAQDVAAAERCKKKESWLARRAGRDLRDSRRAQVEVRGPRMTVGDSVRKSEGKQRVGSC